MREITIKKTIYKYEELKADAKEKVKQEMLTWRGEDDTFTDMVEEGLKSMFPKSDLRFRYSLDFCQGDGFNIYGKLDMNDFLTFVISTGETDKTNFDFSETELKIIKNMLNYADGFKFMFNQRYCYSHKFLDKETIKGVIDEIISNIEYTGELQENEYNKDLLMKFYIAMIDYFENLDKIYEEEGYKYFYEIEEDEIIEDCKANDYEFYENGTLY